MEKNINCDDNLIYNPAYNVILQANAGCGKTFALVQRVLNLLLNGIKPEKIICITYTNAAAEEMRERIFIKLANIFMKNKHNAYINDALKNFDKIGIQTFHSFCKDYILSFDRGENINILDDGDDYLIVKHSIHKFFKTIARNVNSDISKMITYFFYQYGVDNLINILAYMILNINGKNNILNKTFYKTSKESIANDLNVSKSALEKYILEENDLYFLKNDYFATEKEEGKIDFLFNLSNTFFTQKMELRKKIPNTMNSDIFHHISGLLATFYGILYDKECIDININLLNISNIIYDLYCKTKNTNRLFNYGDIINNSLNMNLDNIQSYNILIDEAQDLSSKQWSIIDKLFQNNTIFIVGDEKQSIYSFQGGDVLAYKNALERYKIFWLNNKINYIENILQKSYRSSAQILEYVDKFCYINNIGNNEKHISALDTKVKQNSCVKDFYPKNSDEIYQYIEDCIKDLDETFNIMILCRKRDSIYEGIVNNLSVINGDKKNQDCNTKNNFIHNRSFYNSQICKKYENQIKGTSDKKIFQKNNIIVTTIHSAKGLESDIVFFIDTHPKMKSINYIMEDTNNFLILPAKLSKYKKFSKIFTGLHSSILEYEEMEENRLRYVALTRAKISLHHIILS